MESNAAVTLHFEDLVDQNYLFLKDVCIRWWTISNCLEKEKKEEVEEEEVRKEEEDEHHHHQTRIP